MDEPLLYERVCLRHCVSLVKGYLRFRLQAPWTSTDPAEQPDGVTVQRRTLPTPVVRVGRTRPVDGADERHDTALKGATEISWQTPRCNYFLGSLTTYRLRVNLEVLDHLARQVAIRPNSRGIDTILLDSLQQLRLPRQR